MQHNIARMLVLMTSLTIGAIVVVSFVRPGDNSVIIGHILTIAIPTTTSLLAFLRSTANTQDIRSVHVDLNSRLDQLLLAEKSASHAEGVEAERNREK